MRLTCAGKAVGAMAHNWLCEALAALQVNKAYIHLSADEQLLAKTKVVLLVHLCEQRLMRGPFPGEEAERDKALRWFRRRRIDLGNPGWIRT